MDDTSSQDGVTAAQAVSFFMKSFENTLLRIHGVILMLLGCALAVQTMLGKTRGVGVLAFLQDNPIASIGFFEAYCLAAIIGLALFMLSRHEKTYPWNFLAAGVHVILAGTNIHYWDVYAELDIQAAGIASTAMHFVFIILESFAGWRNLNSARGSVATP